ncbi:hypothetical protein TNCV_2009341 [Trichonephila clavipes]|nr:hypothetical protein TNCV_2009341 [Trichonephila clavipes]
MHCGPITSFGEHQTTETDAGCGMDTLTSRAIEQSGTEHKDMGWVNYTPLVISHWQASKVCTTLHLSLSSIPMVQTSNNGSGSSRTLVTKACQNIWSMICLVYSFILK